MDEEHFKQFNAAWNSCAQRLERFSRKCCPHSPDDANALYSDTYVKAAANWPPLRNENPCGWFLTIMNRLFLDERRQSKRRPTVSLDEPWADSTLSQEQSDTVILSGRYTVIPGSDEHIATIRIKGALEAAQAELPEQWRIFQSHVYDDRTISKLAEEFGLTNLSIKEAIAEVSRCIRGRLSEDSDDLKNRSEVDQAFEDVLEQIRQGCLLSGHQTKLTLTDVDRFAKAFPVLGPGVEKPTLEILAEHFGCKSTTIWNSLESVKKIMIAELRTQFPIEAERLKQRWKVGTTLPRNSKGAFTARELLILECSGLAIQRRGRPRHDAPPLPL